MTCTIICPNCQVRVVVDVNTVAAAPSMQADVTAASSGPGFPLLKYDHRFTSQAELDDYERRVREREANLDGSDAPRQATLQEGQVDVKAISREQLEGLLVAIGRNEVGLSAKYGPTKLLNELLGLMKASGITDDGTGHIVPPPSFPELADMTVDRAKQLAGLA